MMQPGEVYIIVSVCLHSLGLIIDGSLRLPSSSASAARRGPGWGTALLEPTLYGDARGASEGSQAPALLRVLTLPVWGSAGCRTGRPSQVVLTWLLSTCWSPLASFCPQPLHAPIPTSPLHRGSAAGTQPALEGISVEGAVPRSPGSPGCCRTVLGLTAARVRRGWGSARVPQPPGTAFPPAAGPELLSLWDGTKQFLSLSFLRRRVTSLPRM